MSSVVWPKSGVLAVPVLAVVIGSDVFFATSAKLDCVCWKPDGSTTCDGGTSKRYCFNIKDNLSCNDIRVRPFVRVLL